MAAQETHQFNSLLSGPRGAAIFSLQAPMSYSTRIDEAFGFAHRLHRDQKRKATEIPYISHLMAVAALVAEHGGTEDQVIAALLHDAMEDQGGRAVLEEIRGKYGETVARIVEGCTDADPEHRPPWRERKEAYLSHLKHAPADVQLVSACDKLHNGRCIVAGLREHGPRYFERFNGGQSGTLWYYRSLVEAYPPGNLPAALMDELRRVVGEMESQGD